jgi:hypothetical protein
MKYQHMLPESEENKRIQGAAMDLLKTLSKTNQPAEAALTLVYAMIWMLKAIDMTSCEITNLKFTDLMAMSLKAREIELQQATGTVH